MLVNCRPQLSQFYNFPQGAERLSWNLTSLRPLFLGALIQVCACKMVSELASDFIFARIILFFISEVDRSL